MLVEQRGLYVLRGVRLRDLQGVGQLRVQWRRLPPWTWPCPSRILRAASRAAALSVGFADVTNISQFYGFDTFQGSWGQFSGNSPTFHDRRLQMSPDLPGQAGPASLNASNISEPRERLRLSQLLDECGCEPLLIRLRGPAAVHDQESINFGRHERVDQVNCDVLVEAVAE
jgi:hypothetical protein